MNESDLSVIEMSLSSLRQRIRRVQFVRGFTLTLTAIFGGLLLAMSLDFFVGAPSERIRWIIRIVWLGGIAIVAGLYLIRPLSRKISLMQIARWLEIRHPEVEERISSALQCARNPDGVSPDLVMDLCSSAAMDVQNFHPVKEIKGKSARRSLNVCLTLLSSLILLLALWPGQVGRLFLRTVSPFSTLGNAGAVQFKIEPGDFEMLEGEDQILTFQYQGDLNEPFRFVTEFAEETLSPIRQEGEWHEFQYHLRQASRSFRYHARIGNAESDRYQLRVIPKPRLQDIRVKYLYPQYTSLAPREAELGAGLKALIGTRVTLKGALNTPIENAILDDGRETKALKTQPTHQGGEVTWSWVLEPEEPFVMRVLLKHRLAAEHEAVSFPVEATKDLLPVITLKSPSRSQIKMSPDDVIPLDYFVEDDFGLSLIELEFEGRPELTKEMSLPTQEQSDTALRWHGLNSFSPIDDVPALGESKKFRFRLKASDNRPKDLGGPGVGFSQWIEVIFDENAHSLVRQNLKEEQNSLREALAQARQDIKKAQNEMLHVRSALKKETLPQKKQEALARGRQGLAEGEKRLNELAERMQKTVQAHRSESVAEVGERLNQSRRQLEDAPLQDTGKLRQEKLDAAVDSSRQALAMIQKIADQVNQDDHKLHRLAQLEELSQRQAQLARENAAEKNWQNRQKQVYEKIRQTIRQSPQAAAATLEREANRSSDLAKEGASLLQAQERMRGGEMTSKNLRDQFQAHQSALMETVKEQLLQARKEQDQRANELADVFAKAKEATSELTSEKAARSAASLAKANADEALLERQQDIEKGLRALENDDLDQARSHLQRAHANDLSNFANKVKKSPQLQGRGEEIQRAIKESLQASRKAQEKKDQEAFQSLQASSHALKQASQQAKERAADFEAQQAASRELSLPGEIMSKAFEHSASASTASNEQQAQASAVKAAKALRRAVKKTRQAMSQNKDANDPELMPAGQAPSENDLSERPGERGSDAEEMMVQKEGANQGVPPQLAKLGISSQDWEKIKSQLNSGGSLSQEAVFSDDYRSLIQKYFQELAKEE